MQPLSPVISYLMPVRLPVLLSGCGLLGVRQSIEAVGVFRERHPIHLLLFNRSSFDWIKVPSAPIAAMPCCTKAAGSQKAL